MRPRLRSTIATHRPHKTQCPIISAPRSLHSNNTQSYANPHLGTQSHGYPAWPQLTRLGSPSIATFQTAAFQPAIPVHLPSTFALPAITRWIERSDATPMTTGASSILSEPYFAPFQDDLYLPMELTTFMPKRSFTRTEAPLALFLKYLTQLPRQTTQQHQSQALPRMYIAQAPLQLLPAALRDDVPTPELVLKAGRGDIYASSLWMGPSFAARTPLHRDPNANMLVQIAGGKAVRLLPPDIALAFYRAIIEGRRSSAAAVGSAHAGAGTMRGEEMMGEEGDRLDATVWDEECVPSGACEVVLVPGDGVFIPSGWSHSIRGLHDGINISANWWFR